MTASTGAAVVTASTPPVGILSITKAPDGTASLQVADDRVTIGLTLTADECTQLANAFAASPPASTVPPATAPSPTVEAAAILADPTFQAALATAISNALTAATATGTTTTPTAAPAASGGAA